MTGDDSDDTADEVQHVERTDVGASIAVDVTRGTGTRDQEKFKIKGKGEDAEAALAEFEMMLQKYEAEYSDRVRAIQPEEGDDE